MHRKYYILYLLLLACAFTACTPRSIREAQEVVAQADSLWAKGCVYSDSAELAQAYETLGQWQWFYADEYAHACYHYGRILREKEHPVEAMQCFINATHSHTRDYHILGRVYSNMGDICRLEGNHCLACFIFKQSANLFLQNGDSIFYFYGLNNIAFELTEQREKEEALNLQSYIEDNCSIHAVTAKSWETKAELYRISMQYDSSLYYINLLQAYGNRESTGTLIKAQAYYGLMQKDSALFYARKIVADSCSDYRNKFNALYIISHVDSTLCASEISKLDSQREDIRYYKYEPEKEKLTQAVQLLEQELNRKQDRRWVYVVIALVLFVGSCTILYYLWCKRKQLYQIIQNIKKKKKEHILLENTLSNLFMLQETQHRQIIEDVETVCNLLHNSSDIRTELCWNDYGQMCTIVNRRLYNIIDRLQPFSLSEKEIRLCVLVLLQADTKQLADMIPYSLSGLGKFKYTTARKLGTTTVNLRSFILNLMG